MTIGFFSEQIGTTGNDFFNQTVDRINYGLQGNDSFSFGSSTSIFTEDTAAFIGGSGADTYSLSGSNTAAIVYDGSNSTGDVFSAPGLGVLGDAYFAIIDGKHLYVGDDDSEQYALILDWQSPLNRIESFQTSNGTYSYAEYSSVLLQAIQDPNTELNYEGSFTWEQVISAGEIDLASFGLNAGNIDIAINLVKARASQLEQSQSSSNPQDLNGDGKTDLFLYNPQFQWSGVAYMDGADIIGSAPLWNGWKSLGSSDFNKDGNTDVVVQNHENDWYGILYMDGSGGIQSSQSILGWQDWDIISTGNFNDDGTEDILIRHQSQPWYGIWYMGGSDGSQIVSSQGIAMWDGWDIKGAGDFNQDGRSDLVVQHQTEGWAGILYLNDNQQIVSSESIPGWTDWNIVGTADLNNDGQVDLLIEHKKQPWDGVLYMNGGQVASSAGLSTWDGWQITG